MSDDWRREQQRQDWAQQDRVRDIQRQDWSRQTFNQETQRQAWNLEHRQREELRRANRREAIKRDDLRQANRREDNMREDQRAEDRREDEKRRKEREQEQARQNQLVQSLWAKSRTSGGSDQATSDQHNRTHSSLPSQHVAPDALETIVDGSGESSVGKTLRSLAMIGLAAGAMWLAKKYEQVPLADQSRLDPQDDEVPDSRP